MGRLKFCESSRWGWVESGGYVGLTVICCRIKMILVRVGYMWRERSSLLLIITNEVTMYVMMIANYETLS